MVTIPNREEVEKACMSTICCTEEGSCTFCHESITTGYSECLLKDSNGNYPWQPEWMEDEE